MLKYKPRYDLQRKMSLETDLKVLPASYFNYNTEEKDTGFSNLKIQLNRINTRFPMQVV